MISIVPEIAELQREIGPGKCAFCEDPITARVHCSDAHCVRAYKRVRMASKRQRNRALGINSRGTAIGSSRK